MELGRKDGRVEHEKKKRKREITLTHVMCGDCCGERWPGRGGGGYRGDKW